MITYTTNSPRPHVRLPDVANIDAWCALLEDLEAATKSPPVEPEKLLALRGLAEHRLISVVQTMRYHCETGVYDSTRYNADNGTYEQLSPSHSREQVLKLIERLLAIRVPLMAVSPPYLSAFG